MDHKVISAAFVEVGMTAKPVDSNDGWLQVRRREVVPGWTIPQNQVKFTCLNKESATVEKIAWDDDEWLIKS